MPWKSLCVPIILAALCAGPAFSGNHKDKPGKGNTHGLTAGNSGKIPPGQIKRYTRGAKLPADLDFVRINDLSKYKLPKPGKGESYVIIDNDIVKVLDETNTVIDAIGIVGDWLK